MRTDGGLHLDPLQTTPPAIPRPESCPSLATLLKGSTARNLGRPDTVFGDLNPAERGGAWRVPLAKPKVTPMRGKRELLPLGPTTEEPTATDILESASISVPTIGTEARGKHFYKLHIDSLHRCVLPWLEYHGWNAIF